MKDLKKNSWPEALFIPLERSTPDDFQDSVESRIKSFMNETYMDPAAALIISTSDLENWVYAVRAVTFLIHLKTIQLFNSSFSPPRLTHHLPTS